MNIVQEKVDALNAVLKVQLAPADYQTQVDSALRKYSKKVSMPGFRPGMVPMNLVRKMYGKALLVDELNRIVGDSVDKYLSENNIQILGNPMPKSENEIDLDTEKPGDFEFAFEMGLAPEVNLTLPPAHTFTDYEITVDEKAIDEEVIKVRKRYGDYTSPEACDADCSVYGRFDELDANGQVVEGGRTNSSFLLLDKIKDASVRQQFIGKKVQDWVEFNPETAIGSTEEVKYLLGLKTGEVANTNCQYRCTIERINKVEMAELNTALFDRLYGDGQVADEAAFREKIRAEIAEGYRYESEHSLKHEMEDELLKATNLQLPDEFLKRWLMKNNEKITAEQLGREYNQYARDLKWRLIENKIYRDQNMEITQEEIENYTRTLILDQYLRYGQAHLLTDEKLKELTGKYLQNADSVQRAIESLSSRKVFEYLNKIIQKNVQKVAHDEFVDIMARHHQEHHH